MTRLEREVRLLKIYALFTAIWFPVLTFGAFRGQQRREKVLDVERLNIVSADGKIARTSSSSTKAATRSGDSP